VAQMEALPHAVSQCENLKKPRFEKSNLGGTVLPVPLNSGIGKCGTSPFCILRGSTFFIQICVESEMVRECCYPSRQTKNLFRGVAYYYIVRVVAYHCLHAFWCLAGQAFSSLLAYGRPFQAFQEVLDQTSTPLGAGIESARVWASHGLKL
jgi:hypothetical protein